METLKAFITLLALINPFGAIPMFLSLTAHFSPGQVRHTINTAAFSTAVVIAVSALLGRHLLELFGISIASLQVGGGALLFLLALGMFNAADPGRTRSTPEEEHEAAERSSIAVVPLTIPLLTGPATMSTVVIYADQAKTFLQHAALVGYGVVIALATAVCFALAKPIARVLGQTGINVMTRLMGLILAALAVEVMAAGLTKLFPALGG